jgi:hypothetical protein
MYEVKVQNSTFAIEYSIIEQRTNNRKQTTDNQKKSPKNNALGIVV